MPFGSLKPKRFSYQMLFSFIICWEWMVLLEHSAAKEKEHIRLSLCPPRQRLFFMLRRKGKWRCKTINTGAVRLISPPAQIHDTPFNGFLGKMRQKKRKLCRCTKSRVYHRENAGRIMRVGILAQSCCEYFVTPVFSDISVNNCIWVWTGSFTSYHVAGDCHWLLKGKLPRIKV